MASTPTPTPTPTPAHTQPQPQPISIKTAARKLPIKRKSPDYNPNPNFIPKIETSNEEDEEEEYLEDLKPQPSFKFHRIWTESDEIRFLQGLLDSSTDGLIFPRDLPLFYNRFSESIPQPYTKSQLSEKLRRLRKKFHVISARLARGLDFSLSTPHDRSLFDLSKQLWHPSYSSSSPFNSNKKKKPTCVSVEVSFSPNFTPSLSTLPPPTTHPQIEFHKNSLDLDDDNEINNVSGGNLDDGQREKLDILDVAVNFDDGQVKKLNLLSGDGKFDDAQGEKLGFLSGGGVDELGQIASKTIMDVFDRSLKEIRMGFLHRGLLYPDDRPTSASSGYSELGKATDLLKRCQEQRVAELDVFARRMRSSFSEPFGIFYLASTLVLLSDRVFQKAGTWCKVGESIWRSDCR